MGNDLDVIKQLGKEVGKELEVRDFEDISYWGKNFYAVDDRGRVIGLTLDNLELVQVPQPLSRLDGLLKLSLSSNRLTDISALKGLTALTTLILSFNQLTDTSVIKGLNALTELDLSHNQLTDISAIKGLKKLHSLFFFRKPNKRHPTGNL